MDRVTTVLGDVDADQLGLTLCHEHLFIDIRNQYRGGGAHPDALGQVRRSHAQALGENPYAIRDNLVLEDVRVAAAEIRRVDRHGCRTVVDCTPGFVGASPRALREVARRSRLNIIAGMGFYTHDTHPRELAGWPVEHVAELMQRDLEMGLGDSGVRPGVLGEIGTSNPIHPDEEKCLLAAAAVFRLRRIGIQVHTYPWARHGLPAARILLDHGVDPRKIVICHTDVQLDRAYIKDLLDLGVFVEFDDFGKEFPVSPATAAFAGGPFATDAQRVAEVRLLVDQGHIGQLLLTNDVCFKSMLHAYGGRGYDHLFRSIVPGLLAAGLDQAAVDTLLRENPKALLAG